MITTNFNNSNDKMFILHYYSHNNVDIVFDDGTIVKNREYSKFLKGQIKNPNKPCICNVGFFGQGIYDSSHKSYYHWRDMIRRVYGNIERSKFYEDCSVCQEWFNFQNFALWFDDNYYTVEDQRMELDKDILKKGNKIYSPETCVFVPKNINLIFVKSNSNRGNLPIGITKSSKNTFRVRCGSKYIGNFYSIEDAFFSYKQEKEKQIKELADKYKEYIPSKLYEVMYNYDVDIND